MPRNGAGIYSRPASDVNPPVALAVIDPVAVDGALADIASELTNSLDRLGRGAMEAALPMGGFRVTGVGSSVLSTDAATLSDVMSYVPAGAIMDFAMSTPPTGWLVCDGTAVSRVTYASLYAAVGTTWGPGDGVTTFNLPDFRGRFRRTWDNGAGNDPARTFASVQADGFASHTHIQNAHNHIDSGHTHIISGINGAVSAAGGAVNAGIAASTTGNGVANIQNTTAVNQTTGGAETRPKNYAVQTCIRT